MARKRVVEAPSLHSWEDVNDALRQIAEAQIALGEIQSDMQKQILGAQKVAEEQSKPLNDNVAKLEREIKSFVTDHRDEMGKTKSMVLTFGEVGFRLSTSVSLPRAKEKLEEIQRETPDMREWYRITFPPDDGLHRGGREGQQGGSEEVR